ncbi:uncharacterized protein [Diabrotica undecimpunctata]|uniref:uncharacterized protein n=1 Tax=Diabrotica undecimpunctata TaxID=50387 RepID=UPI003B642AB4
MCQEDNKLKDNNDSDLMKDVDVANTSSASNIVAVGVLEDFSSDDSIADPIYLPQPGYSSSSDEGNSNIKRTKKTNMCQEDNKLKDNNDSDLMKGYLLRFVQNLSRTVLCFRCGCRKYIIS